MIGRETKTENDLFFVCAVIEALGRQTHNERRTISHILGRETLNKYFELADVYHSEPIEKHVCDLITEFSIKNGLFDNIAACKYAVPTVFDIAKVYKRLIYAVAAKEKTPVIDALFTVYNSWIAAKIDNYNSSFYYENPDYIFQSYVNGEPLE